MISVPQQAIPDSKKNLAWVQDVVNGYENIIFFDFKTIRANWYNKVRNQQWMRGVIDRADYMNVLDNYRTGVMSFPDHLKHVGIGKSRVSRLHGEHILRPFDFRAVISSGDEFGVSRKEQAKAQQIQQFFIEKLQQEVVDPKQLQAEIQKNMDFFKYDWQDTAEIGANIILNYYYQEQNLKEKFDNQFEKGLVFGEQAMLHDKVVGEMIIEDLDPLRLFYLSDSNNVTEEGLEVFVYLSYFTPSTIQDKYYDVLTKEQMETVQNYRNYWDTYSGVPYPKLGYSNNVITVNSETPEAQLVLPDASQLAFFGSPIDTSGNIRVTSTYWKSKRKVKKIESFNELGLKTTSYVHEKYKIDPNSEFVVREEWISEWWKCDKIGADIYINYGPVDYLNTSINNISKQEPPITLQIYNFNSSKAQSLVDLIKPFDFWYDIYSDRRDRLVTLLKPDVLAYNTSMIPEGLDEESWLLMLETTGVAPEDPTRRVPSGPAMNKPAGQVANTSLMRYIESRGGQSIKIIDDMMNSVVNQMDTVCGINSQRLGDIAPREAVANVQSANMNSAYITEKWFATNEYFKKRVMQKTLNIGKEILRQYPQKLSWLMDDYTQLVMTDEMLHNVKMCDFDIIVTSSTKYEAIKQKVEMLFDRAVASGNAKISQLAELFTTTSLAAGIRKLKNNEQQAEQAQAQAEQNKLQQEKQMHDENLALQYAKIDADINKAAIQSLGFEKDTSTEDILKARDMALKERQQTAKELQDARQNEQDREALRLKEKEIEVKKQQANKPKKS